MRGERMPQTRHTECHFTTSETVRDSVIGMSDGLTSLVLVGKMLLANPKMLGNKMNKTGIIIGVKI